MGAELVSITDQNEMNFVLGISYELTLIVIVNFRRAKHGIDGKGNCFPFCECTAVGAYDMLEAAEDGWVY